MKKIYFVALATAFSSNLFAQTNIETFESFTLNNQGHLVGTDANDWLIGEHMDFWNDYNTEWYSWRGFAISNVQDNTTASYGNQYAAITNGGDNSAQYGVMYEQGKITLHQPSYLKSLRITNTTYAALAMRDGDMFTKQFGSSMNAAGEVDGTDGNDFFRVKISFTTEDETVLSEVKEFYLADYRFQDNTQDYILMDWATVTFPEIEGQAIKSISFALESSDMADWGMNNPAYFAIDNIEVETAVTGVKNVIASIPVYPNPTKDVVFIGATTQSWELMDLTGKTLSKGTASKVDLTTLPAGVYVLKMNTNEGSALTRIQKI